MKYLILILSFFLIFTACNTKAETIPTIVEEKPLPPPPPPSRPDFSRRVLVNQEIVNWIKQLDESDDDIKRLIFYLDKEFSLEIDNLNYDPIVGIASDGMLIINAHEPPPIIRFSTFLQGRIESFTPAINETFVIGITIDGEPVSMRFRKNARYDHFEIYSMEFPTGNYNIKSEAEFPKLFIYASIDENIRNPHVHTADFVAVPANSSAGAKLNTKIPVPVLPNTDAAEHEKAEIDHPVTHEETDGADVTDNKMNSENEDILKITGNTENEKETPEIAENENSAEVSDKVTAEVKKGNETVVDTKAAGTALNQNVLTQAQPTPAPVQPAQTQAAQTPVQTQTAQNNAAGQTNVTKNTARSTNIIASGVLKSDTIFNFIKSKPYTTVISDTLVRELIDLYIDEAKYEEINHDFAIAQMLYQTTMLSNRQFVRANNFGGLTPVRGEFDGTFTNRERGVRAHIHQLRGYAKGTVVREPVMSPRWEMISNANKGKVQTFEQLYEKWSAYPRYREKIESLLRELYLFSDNSATR